MKKLCCLLYVIIILTILCSSAMATERVCLSELNDEECYAFLETYGIIIPEANEDSTVWMSFVHNVIIQVEENPNIEFAYGYVNAQRLAYEIKAAVLDYYGVENMCLFVVPGPSLLVQDSEPYGTWESSYANQNCYSFAIEYCQGKDPGIISGLCIEGTLPYYLLSGDVNDVVDCVIADFETLHYTITECTTAMPDTVVSDHVNLICVRTDLNGIIYYSFNDYHFMKKGADGNWYHKPGGSLPLRYLHTPSNDRTWVSEGYLGSEMMPFRNSDVTYDSEIWFIEYTTPHTYEYQMHGFEQHVRVCTICGETVGAEMSCIYINNVCKFCGRIKISGGGIITSVNKEDGE